MKDNLSTGVAYSFCHIVPLKLKKKTLLFSYKCSLPLTFENSLDPDQARQSGSKLFDILMVFLKRFFFFEKVDSEKKQKTKKLAKLPSRQGVKSAMHV